MNRILAAFALLLTLSTASIAAQDDVRADGTWWNKLSATERLAVVVGAIDAYIEAYAGGQLSLRDKPPWPVPPRFPGAYSYYVDAITDYYSGHPEHSSVDFALVLECLAEPKGSSQCALLK